MKESWLPQYPKPTTDITKVRRVVDTQEQIKRKKFPYAPKQEKSSLGLIVYNLAMGLPMSISNYLNCV